MAAGVVNKNVSRGLDVWGHFAVCPFSYVGPNPYATGGESIVDSVFKLGDIEYVTPIIAFSADRTQAVLFQYDPVSNKMMAYWGNTTPAGVLPEVTNATDLSGFSGLGMAFGKG